MYGSNLANNGCIHNLWEQKLHNKIFYLTVGRVENISFEAQSSKELYNKWQKFKKLPKYYH